MYQIPGLSVYLWANQPSMSKLRIEDNSPRALSGEAWFNGLFDRYYVPVRNFAFQLLGDMDAAQETAQDVFVRLWEKGSRHESEQGLRSFLFTAAKNLCVDRIRSDRTVSEYRRKIMLKYSSVAESFLDDFISSDLQQTLNRHIDALPPQCAHAFRLSRMEHLKYKEIAERMDVSVKTVEAHVSRAISILRQKMGDHLFLAVILLLLSGE